LQIISSLRDAIGGINICRKVLSTKAFRGAAGILPFNPLLRLGIVFPHHDNTIVAPDHFPVKVYVVGLFLSSVSPFPEIGDHPNLYAILSGGCVDVEHERVVNL
jgi:hypothetical protein